MALRSGTIGNPGDFGALGRERSGWVTLWGVAERYAINDKGVITPIWPPEKNGSRRSRAYDLLGSPGMAIALANVIDEAANASAANRDHLRRQAVLAFVSDWGLLEISGPSRVGEPQSETVKEIWKLALFAKKVVEAMEANELSSVRRALSQKLQGISPMLVLEGGTYIDNEATSGSFRYALRVPTLRDAVALHLSDLAVGGNLGNCEDCGRSFIATDKRMRFCPGIKGIRGSRCQDRNKKRRRREKRKDAEQQSRPSQETKKDE